MTNIFADYSMGHIKQSTRAAGGGGGGGGAGDVLELRHETL